MKRPKFEVYKAKDGYRWRLIAANGKVVAEGGEAYKRLPSLWPLYAKISHILSTSEPEVKP